MKKTISVILLFVLIISIFMSGCSFEFRSIDALMRPPHTSMEGELKSSINKLLGNQISYRAPEKGGYHSAITMRDINGDGAEEAIVFYVNNDDASVARMCVLTKLNDDWALAGDFAGNGSGILEVEFADLNCDKDEEIMVTWFLFDDKSQKSLSVYTSSSVNESLTVSACISEPYNLMMIADVYSDGNKQILIANSNITRENKKSSVRLIGIDENDKVLMINETALDDRIISLSSLLSDIEPGKTAQRFFIDGIIADGQCITQVFTWDTEKSKFVSVINDKNNPDVTLRSSDLLCKDVDDDGVIEIPLKKAMSESINSDTSLGYLLVWCKAGRKGLVPCEYYVVNLLENYTLFYPQGWRNKIYVKSENDARKWHFVNTKDETLFTITAYSFADWDENSSDYTEVLMIQHDTVYCCTVTDTGVAADISAADLLNYFSLNF